MGDVHGPEIPARFFLAYSNRGGDGDIELFFIFEGERTKLDTYVFSERQLYAERLAAKVLRETCVSLGHSFRLAAINLRRDILWENHSLPHNHDPTSTNAEEAMEMCQLSSQTSLTMVDSRLTSLLSDASDLDINWPSLFFSMRQDPLFSHCITFQVPGKTTSAYLFHFAGGNKFVMFELGADGCMLDSKILLRQESADGATKAAKCRAVELVVNWILHFLWHNL